MHTGWLGSFFGTRHARSAPFDLLLLLALSLVVIAGTVDRLLPHAQDGFGLCSYSSLLTLALTWDGTSVGYAYTADFITPDALPTGSVVVHAVWVSIVGGSGGIGLSSDPSASYPFDDGDLFVGDRLVSAHPMSTLWVHTVTSGAAGEWQVTGWTLLVRHKGHLHTLHLTNPPLGPGCYGSVKR